MPNEPPRTASWVLLHGTPLTPTVWRDTARLLSDQRVLVPDCTRVPDTDAQATLAAEVATAVGDASLDVVGHSFGGQIALDLALLRPQQVRSLTILCSRDTPFPAFAQTAEAVRAGGPPSVEAGLERWFTAEEVRDEGPAVQEARRELERASRADWAAALDAIATFDRSSRSADLTMPVALLAAGGDAVSAPAVMEEMAARISRATFAVHPAWMHMSPFVDPSGLAGLLRDARGAALA
ncbi:MAG: alpha/beta fold hydrolase [Nocardioidaceae bacterium]